MLTVVFPLFSISCGLPPPPEQPPFRFLRERIVFSITAESCRVDAIYQFTNEQDETAASNITIDLPTEDDLTLEVFNLSGVLIERLISDRWIAGAYRIRWEGASYAAGVYFVKAATSTKMAVRKIVLLK